MPYTALQSVFNWGKTGIKLTIDQKEISFIDLFAEGQHSSVHVQLTGSVLGGNRQRGSCLSANTVANTLNSMVSIQYADTSLEGREWVAE